jgi:acetyltransferase
MDGVSKPTRKPWPKNDPAHDVLRAEGGRLDSIFSPRSAAVIGASEQADSIGRRVLWSLVSSPFGGTVFPVARNKASVLGIKAYPGVKEVPEHIDLAVIVTPAETVPGIIGECVEAGVKGAIVISAGFREHGAEGAALEQAILDQVRGSRMRIIGPNCTGVMNPLTGLNATSWQQIARPGSVAFISQSGALSSAVLDWSLTEMVGFSAFISVGSMLDVGWGDLIDYFGDDSRTQAIIIYMESIGNAPAFLSAAREVSLNKPIIVVKSGRSEPVARAVVSHTGVLTGRDEVLDAAFRRSGVLRVNTVSDLFYMAEVLSKQPRPRGPRLAIITNAGGPGVLAADATVATGGELAKLSEHSMELLNGLLPPHWSHNNPIDILGDAGPERFSTTIDIAAKDSNVDGLVVVTAPQGLAQPSKIAEALKPFAKSTGKPVLACFMGGAEVAVANQVLNSGGIPTFNFPDPAARAFNYMWRYSYNLRGLYETPVMRAAGAGIDSAAADAIIRETSSAGRTILNEVESKRLLASYRIPVVDTRIAHSENEAVQLAAEIGYPVVLKVLSHGITHKARAGGVRLNLFDADAVRRAYASIHKVITGRFGAEQIQGVAVQPMVRLEGYELILGSSIDPQFGPVLLFGTGGLLVEAFRDRALALPPLNTTLARRMMEQTKIYTSLRGLRGEKPVDVASLEELLVRFSQLVVEHPRILELDINPLLASSDRLLALDARVVLHPPELGDELLPRPSIRPYPSQYVSTWKLKRGDEVIIRPIRPEDEPLMIRFHEKLSDRTVYLRYFQPLKLSQRTAHERLTRICFIDYRREMALVVEWKNPQTGEIEIIAVGRLSKLHGTNDAESAVLVRDEFQHQGLGTELFRRNLMIARDERLRRVLASTMTENFEMRAICKKLGFQVKVDIEDQLVRAVIELGNQPPLGYDSPKNS